MALMKLLEVALLFFKCPREDEERFFTTRTMRASHPSSNRTTIKQIKRIIEPPGSVLKPSNTAPNSTSLGAIKSRYAQGVYKPKTTKISSSSINNSIKHNLENCDVTESLIRVKRPKLDETKSKAVATSSSARISTGLNNSSCKPLLADARHSAITAARQAIKEKALLKEKRVRKTGIAPTLRPGMISKPSVNDLIGDESTLIQASFHANISNVSMGNGTYMDIDEELKVQSLNHDKKRIHVPRSSSTRFVPTMDSANKSKEDAGASKEIAAREKRESMSKTVKNPSLPSSTSKTISKTTSKKVLGISRLSGGTKDTSKVMQNIPRIPKTITALPFRKRVVKLALKQNPVLAEEYQDDIYTYWKELEVSSMPVILDYMVIQPELEWSMRTTLISWLVQVHSQFRLLPETLFLTVNLLDRTLASKRISVGKLQLVGITALLIASKYEEILSPSVDDLVYMVDNAFKADEILIAERHLLGIVGYQLGYCNPLNFLRRLIRDDPIDPKLYALTQYFLEIMSIDYQFIQYPPSFLAAVAYFLAFKSMFNGDWTMAYVSALGYTEEVLLPCVYALLHRLTNFDGFQLIFEKFNTEKYFNVKSEIPTFRRDYQSTFLEKMELQQANPGKEILERKRKGSEAQTTIAGGKVERSKELRTVSTEVEGAKSPSEIPTNSGVKIFKEVVDNDIHHNNKPPNRQGLLAIAASKKTDEEIVIDLSDQESVSSTSEYHSEYNYDSPEDRNDVDMKMNPRMNPPTEERLDWNDEIDDYPSQLTHNNGNGRRRERQSNVHQKMDIPKIQKKTSASNRALEQGSASSASGRYHDNFRNRSSDHADSSNRWTHDKFEENDNSDLEPHDFSSRHGKRAVKPSKKKSAQRKSSGSKPNSKQLFLKKAIQAPGESTKGNITSNDALNWVDAVSSEKESSVSPDMQKNSRENQKLADNTAGSIIMTSGGAILEQHKGVEKDLSGMSINEIQPSPPKMAGKSGSDMSIAEADSERSIKHSNSFASVNAIPSATTESTAGTPRVRRRPGGALFRSALEKLPVAGPVPRSISPVASVHSASSVVERRVVATKLVTSESETIAAVSLPPSSSARQISKIRMKRQESGHDMGYSGSLYSTVGEKDTREINLRERDTLKNGTGRGSSNFRYEGGGKAVYLKNDRDVSADIVLKDRSGSIGLRDRKKDRDRDRTGKLDLMCTNSTAAISRSYSQGDAAGNRSFIAKEPVTKDRFVVEKKGKGRKTTNHQTSSAVEDSNFNSLSSSKFVATTTSSTDWALVGNSPVVAKERSDKQQRQQRDHLKLNSQQGSTNNSRSYKSKRGSSNNNSETIGLEYEQNINPAHPYNGHQGMITVQPMMTESGHMVLLTDDGLCVPATPGMFNFHQQWYDTAPSITDNVLYQNHHSQQAQHHQHATADGTASSGTSYPNYYRTDYYEKKNHK